MPSTAKKLFIRTIEMLTVCLRENLEQQKAGLPLNEFLMDDGPSTA